MASHVSRWNAPVGDDDGDVEGQQVADSQRRLEAQHILRLHNQRALPRQHLHHKISRSALFPARYSMRVCMLLCIRYS